ncbi:hypothetical protein GCM10009095_00460 [Sphingomonas molluscorum]|nr:hypothetical protein GCM10017606_10900 [Microbacterium terregens]
MRIAVGYGLEKTLPDALCGHIIEEQMLPRFRQGELATGIEAGASALINQLTQSRDRSRPVLPTA